MSAPTLTRAIDVINQERIAALEAQRWFATTMWRRSVLNAYHQSVVVSIATSMMGVTMMLVGTGRADVVPGWLAIGAAIVFVLCGTSMLHDAFVYRRTARSLDELIEEMD